MELLYLKGWSHHSSTDRKKNHNLLLIYALQNIQICHETILDYISEDIMVRYKPDFDNEGDVNRRVSLVHSRLWICLSSVKRSS